ncbi:MAG: methionine ABC transporter ATP-binding protein [Sphaerochaetaceae bacterium]|nr:methionine ABC transporter ATP-binding protein [Sphaerochaetaceae bacterium]
MQIRLENLVRTYGNVHAVDGVSLSIPSNRIFGIIGLSGAGKSTLVRLISLLEKPDSGEVYYDDARVDNMAEKDIILRRRHIGMIFQNFNLFSSRTAGQNVAYPMEICKYPKEEIQARVHELMGIVGLEDRIDAPISTLSGGQKQRVAIARALACKPDILFCDEATSALDPKTTKAILALIKDIQKKMNLTVVMITHQMEVVRDACDQVAVLSDGKIVEQGDVKEIFAHPKTEVSKEFLSHLSSNAKDSEMIRWSESPARYTLKFINDKVDVPVISKVIREYNVDINILGAGVQQVSDEKIGTMVVDITGSADMTEKAINAFREYGIEVEEEKA